MVEFPHSNTPSNVIRTLVVISAIAQGAEIPLGQQVDKVFAKWDSSTSPGCALSVIKDGQIVYKRGYGMADLDHDIPITPETVFHVASISKQFTGRRSYYWRTKGRLHSTTKSANTSPNFIKP